MSDWNDEIVAEFRANKGRLGGNFEGANMALLHHVGRRSGDEFVAPVMFFTDEQLAIGPASSTRYVVASAAGAPKDPQWYANMTVAGRARVEVGTDTFDVVVSEVTDARRDTVWEAIKTAAPGFAEYERKTEGIRTIPVLALDEDEQIERPATWENVVVGKVKEAFGHVVGDDDLVEQGEAQEDVAHEVREEYTDQQD